MENIELEGKWGGYEIEADYKKNTKLRIRTKVGVKGFNIPVKIKCIDKKWIVEDMAGSNIEIMEVEKVKIISKTI